MTRQQRKLVLGGFVLILATLGIWWTLTTEDGDSPVEPSPSVTSESTESSISAPDTTGSTVSPEDESTTSVAADSTVTTVSPSPSTEATVTTLPAADDPDAGSVADDPVPLGDAIVLGDWQIGVSNAVLDATDVVLDYVDFNEPPAEGHQYVIVELSGVNQGSSGGEPVFDWTLVRDAFTHVPEGLECGVIPDSIYDVGVTPPGVEFSANLCFEVPQREASEGLVLTLGMVDASGRERFFALE